MPTINMHLGSSGQLLKSETNKNLTPIRKRTELPYLL